MSCRRARRALGRGEPSAELRRHLARCDACARQAQVDAWIVEGLRSLGGQIPYTIDVRSRVMVTIERQPPALRPEVPAWQLGWAAVGAAAGLLVALGLLWWDGARWLAGIGSLKGTIGGLGDLLGYAASTLLALARFAVELIATLAAAAGRWSHQLGRFEPVAIGGVALCYLIMGGMIMHVVGRDLRNRHEE